MRDFSSLVVILFAGFFTITTPADAQLLSPTKVGDQVDRFQHYPFSFSEEKLNKIIQKMTLPERVGQLFIFGYNGTRLEHSLKDQIIKLYPGAVITYSKNIKNPKQIAELNEKAQLLSLKQSGVPLLLMVDQEGGNVARIRFHPRSPSALGVGMTKNPTLATQYGSATGRALALLGFNMNLAPVMDLSNPRIKNFIGNRSFGSDPLIVTMMSARFAEGMYKSGILPTAKHFPGHGGVNGDSHHRLPLKTKNLGMMEKTDLVPFQFLAELRMPSAIMMAHMSFPELDPTNTPATFSSKIVTDLLKNKMGYPGLVITDDLEMRAAQSMGTIGERAIKALKAGNDMLMVGWSPSKQKKAFKSVLTAYRKGTLPQEHLHKRIRKILSIKLALHPEFPEPPRKPAHLDQQFSLVRKKMDLITTAVTQVHVKNSMPPFDPDKLIDFSNLKFAISADKSFISEMKKSLKSLQTLHIRPGYQKSVYSFINKQTGLVGVFYVTGRGTARILNRLPKNFKKRLIVINTTHPGMIDDQKSFSKLVHIHTRNFKSGRIVVEYLKRLSVETTQAKEPLGL